MRNGNENQRTLIRNAIEQGGLEDLSAVIQAVKDTGALEYVREVAQKEAALACQVIAHIPQNTHHQAIHYQAMVALAESSVSRTF